MRVQIGELKFRENNLVVGGPSIKRCGHLE